jgi:hypothetical protein
MGRDSFPWNRGRVSAHEGAFSANPNPAEKWVFAISDFNQTA